MSMSFDFTAPEQTIRVLGVPASTPGAVTTILLQTATFALSAGRVLRIELETVGVDSAGGALYDSSYLVVAGGSPPVIATITNFNEQCIFPSGIGYQINMSGDLDVWWSNQDATKTHDVSVRIRQRVIGS